RSCSLELSALQASGYPSAMRTSLALNICIVTWGILLLSSSPPCLTLQPLEETDMTKVQYGPWAENDVEDERTSMLNLSNVVPSEQTVSEEPREVSAKPSKMSLSEAFTTEGEILPKSSSHVMPSIQGLGARTSAVAAVPEEELGPTKSELDEEDAFKAMLTTAVTTLNPTVQKSSVGGPVSKATTEDNAEVEPSSASLLATPLTGTAVQEDAETNLHPSAVPWPTLYPSSPIWETASNHPVIPASQTHGMTPEEGTPRDHTRNPLRTLVVQASVSAKHPLTVSEASLLLKAETGVGQKELSATAGTVTIHPVDAVPPDWDDTKLGDVSQGGSSSHEVVTEGLEAAEQSQSPLGSVGEEEDAARMLPTPAFPPPTLELARDTNCTASVQGEMLPAASTGSSDFHNVNMTSVDMADLELMENANAVTAEEGKSILPSQPEAAVVTDTQNEVSGRLESSWKDATQGVTTVSQEADATLSVVTLEPAAMQGTRVASLLQENSGEGIQMPASPSATQMLLETGTSSSMMNIPDVEGISDVVLVSSEKAVPAPSELYAIQSGQTEEPSSRTVVLGTPASMASSVRRTPLPSVRRISTAVTYGLDRLESEEGEEEDEEEEEEEDEEDKDMDLMDESMEGDTELPGFTIPGETSQDPIAGLENPVAQLAGMSYQVPDTIEWEQQNQGLVRSWMEKLKDKAGYMSGMLVPVGVGIAGALFILGALYSIKIMNRRRRSGSKRHKRKQREFNSMQDRVMLLADSSEDEF
ncbi:ARMD4 protein, partial [Rhinopomastus cyanomelas]|nr:ARMD4 protein [Rhinopomastus cyanomelas]